MILGIGTDIIDVARIERSVTNGDHFKNRIFTVGEQEYCNTKKAFAEHYAGRYAVKEAFFKALGTGWRGDLKFTEVEVVNNELGKPDVVLTGEAKRMVDEIGGKVFVSLSHIKETAIAYIIIETK